MASTYKLTSFDNGLRLASEHLPAVESATLCVSFRAGARLETPSQHGLAHLLEHMAFKGTATRNARQIAEAFDDIGGAVNAYTSMERTVYHARVLKEHVPVAMEILADILRNSTFDAEEIVREKEVIVQEIAMYHDTPEDQIFDTLHAVAFGTQHPMGRSILGTPDSVRAFTKSDLQGFTDAHYHAQGMVISAAGNIQHHALQDLVEKHFSGITAEGVSESPAPQFRSGEQHDFRDELEQTQLMMAYEAIDSYDPLFYAGQLLATLFGGGMSSRLFQEVREKRGLAYSVSAFLSSYTDCGLFGIYAATSPDKTAALTELLKEESLKLLDGVTAEELQRAKNQQKAALLMRRESVTAVAEWIANHLQDFNEYRMAAQLAAAVDAVTVDDIRKVAQRIFASPKLALTTLGPKA